MTRHGWMPSYTPSTRTESRGKISRLAKKLNSNLTARIQTRYGLMEPIKIKDSIRQGGVLSVIEYATLMDEIAKELQNKNRNRPRCNNRLPTMDGRCMPNPPRQKQAPEDAGHNKPYSQEIPHRIWSRQMQGSENRQRPKKLPST